MAGRTPQGEADAGPLIAAVDLGGTNTDVLLARPDGTILDAAVLPWSPVHTGAHLLDLLARAAVPLDRLAAVAVTGGRHRELPARLGAFVVRHVEEPEAIGRGGLLAAGLDRALVMSMGTGTAMIAAGPEGYRHLGGTAVGGGTVLGLARLTLGTADPLAIGRLAAAGDPQAVDLSVGDIVGGPVGVVPASMTAAHFGRLARPDADSAETRPEDIAAGLLELVGQVLGRLGLLAAATLGHDALVLTGRLAEWPGIYAAAMRVSGTFGGRVLIPPGPGLATARGALATIVTSDE